MEDIQSPYTDNENVVDMEYAGPVMERGAAYALLLKNPIFGQAVRETKESLFNQMSNTEVDQKQYREDCYLIIRALKLIETTMEETISQAIDLTDQIEREQQSQE